MYVLDVTRNIRRVVSLLMSHTPMKTPYSIVIGDTCLEYSEKVQNEILQG